MESSGDDSVSKVIVNRLLRRAQHPYKARWGLHSIGQADRSVICHDRTMFPDNKREETDAVVVMNPRVRVASEDLRMGCRLKCTAPL
jgi:hypothetical protein